MKELSSEIIYSDNTAALKDIPDNSVDAVVTDPPYGLGKEPDAAEVLKDWIEKGYHEVKAKGGFMNAKWDSFVAQPNLWKEVFRVLKPGGHILVFGGTRTYDWMVMSLRLAGFEIRDQLQWIYGSGFPKSLNISKHIDKQAEAAKQWDGWGTALKPAFEPICLARKPISENTITENVLLHGTGALNIDKSRVGYVNESDLQSATFGRGTDIMGGNFVGGTHSTGKTNIPGDPGGRWPSNVILSHHEDCVYNGIKKVNGSLCKNPSNCNTGGGSTADSFAKMQGNRPARGYGDENNQETVEQWQCHDDCPIKILDQQSGLLKTGAMKKHYEYTNTGSSFGAASGKIKALYEANQGGASRFYYCAKASRSEKNKGLEDIVNAHPTVKPVKLMQYLVRLITAPGGTVLDSFNGSGTTGIACKLENFNYIGIDDDEDNCKISEARIAAW